ncbi:hypothetical protein BH23ACT11_BH23ACT11_15340 [soil metagenome]
MSRVIVDPAQAAAEEGRAFGFVAAEVVSYVFNPLLWPPLQIGLILAHFGAPGSETLTGVLIGTVFFCLAPLGYLVAMHMRGEVASIEVREREKRTKPLLVGITANLVGLALLWLLIDTAAPVVLIIALLYPLNTAITLLVTLRFKISIHVMAAAGLPAGLLFIAANDWAGLGDGVLLTVGGSALLLALIPLLVWARIRARAHTPAEAIAGAAFGLIMPLLELWLIAHVLLGLTA